MAGTTNAQTYKHFDCRDGTSYNQTETDVGNFRFWSDNRDNSGFGQPIGNFDFDYDNRGSGFGQLIGPNYFYHRYDYKADEDDDE